MRIRAFIFIPCNHTLMYLQPMSQENFYTTTTTRWLADRFWLKEFNWGASEASVACRLSRTFNIRRLARMRENTLLTGQEWSDEERLEEDQGERPVGDYDADQHPDALWEYTRE